MHLTDDVHARGAVMVAQMLSSVQHPDYLAWQAARNAFYRGVLDRAAEHAAMEAHYGPVEWSADDVARMKALNASDAALARAFDEA